MVVVAARDVGTGAVAATAAGCRGGQLLIGQGDDQPVGVPGGHVAAGGGGQPVAGRVEPGPLHPQEQVDHHRAVTGGDQVEPSRRRTGLSDAGVG